MKVRFVSACVAALVAATAAIGAQEGKAALKNPAGLKEQAPATYKAAFDTSAGKFVITVHRDWAPKGADRFYNLVKNGFFDDTRFFRVVPNFMVQFGLNGDPGIQSNWANANITDDPVHIHDLHATILHCLGHAPDSEIRDAFGRPIPSSRGQVIRQILT